MRLRTFTQLPRPTKCDTCSGNHISLEQNSKLYGKIVGTWPLLWFCNGCGASVGCHPNTDIPLGKMADRPTRAARKAAHLAFDPIWKAGGKMTRNRAYLWLAQELGISQHECHISWFDKERCEQVITVCKRTRRKQDVYNPQRQSFSINGHHRR